MFSSFANYQNCIGGRLPLLPPVVVPMLDKALYDYLYMVASNKRQMNYLEENLEIPLKYSNSATVTF